MARRICAAEIDLRARRRDLASKVRPLSRAESNPIGGVDIELLIAAMSSATGAVGARPGS